MARRSSLTEYQDELLRKMAVARESSTGVTEQVRYFSFVSAGLKFLIDASKVVEMTNVSLMQPIPMAKPWAVGAANIKGAVFSITDFGMLVSNVSTEGGRFIVLSDDVLSGAALLIDQVEGIFERENIGDVLQNEDLTRFPDWILGAYFFNEDRHLMISSEKLANDERFTKLQTGD